MARRRNSRKNRRNRRRRSRRNQRGGQKDLDEKLAASQKDHEAKFHDAKKEGQELPLGDNVPPWSAGSNKGGKPPGPWSGLKGEDKVKSDAIAEQAQKGLKDAADQKSNAADAAAKEAKASEVAAKGAQRAAEAAAKLAGAGGKLAEEAAAGDAPSKGGSGSGEWRRRRRRWWRRWWSR